MSDALLAHNLTKYYGTALAIEDVSFSLKPGEIAGFLGPNGAGKSTTLRILTALMPATSGEAYICGQSVARHPHMIHRDLGYLPENNPLPEDLRVEEYLTHRARLKGVPHRTIKNAVETSLELSDLSRTARRSLIGNLSKGYRQRVGIAEALLHSPKVLILDEPTIGLDPHQVLKFRDLVNRLKGEITLLISSHLLGEIEAICDKAIIIHHGRIIACGSPTHLRQHFIKKRRYELRILGNKEALMQTLTQTLENIKWHLKPTENSSAGRFHLDVHSDEDLSAGLIKAMSHAPAVELAECHAHTPTLEDIFLAATKRSWEEPSSAAKLKLP